MIVLYAFSVNPIVIGLSLSNIDRDGGVLHPPPCDFAVRVEIVDCDTCMSLVQLFKACSLKENVDH